MKWKIIRDLGLFVFRKKTKSRRENKKRIFKNKGVKDYTVLSYK